MAPTHRFAPYFAAVAGLALLGGTAAICQVRLTAASNWPPAPDQTIDVPGKTAVVLDGSVAGARIGTVSVRNAFRAVDTKDDTTSVRDLVISGLSGTDLQRDCIRLRGAVSNVLIENVRCAMRAEPQTSPNLPIGVHVETGDGVTIQNSSFNGFQMTMEPGSYWNGDGIATERAATNVRIVNVTADDNTDAGFDLKSSNTVLDNVSAKNNNRNYRFWSSIKVGTMTVGDTVKRGGTASSAGIWIEGAGTPPVVVIDRLVVRMSKPGAVIRMENGPVDLRIGSCDIQAPEGTKFIASEPPGTKKTFGAGCPSA